MIAAVFYLLTLSKFYRNVTDQPRMYLSIETTGLDNIVYETPSQSLRYHGNGGGAHLTAGFEPVTVAYPIIPLCYMTHAVNHKVSRLPFFPESFPGETLYGRVSRYHLLSAEPNHEKTFISLFSVPSNEMNFTDAAPFALSALVRRLPGPPHVRLGQLLELNSFVALVMPVLTAPDWEYPDPKFAESNVCLRCAADESAADQLPYLHRSHQLPGVKVCWKHGTRLIDTCPRCEEPFRIAGKFCSVPMLPCQCGWKPLALGTSGHDNIRDQEFAKMAHRVFQRRTYETPASRLIQFFQMHIDHSVFQRKSDGRLPSHNLTIGIAEHLERNHSTLEVASAVSRFIRSGKSPSAWIANLNPHVLEMKARHRRDG